MTTVFEAIQHGAQTNAIQMIILFAMAVVAKKKDGKPMDAYSIGVGWSVFWILVWVGAMLIDAAVRAVWN